VGDLLGRGRREDLRIECSRLGLPALAWQSRLFVLVLGLARRATRLLDVVADHRDNDVIGEPPLARAVIVQDVTKPKLALLHQTGSRRILAGGENSERRSNLSRPVFPWQ
jgi:hypothetical protein